MDVFLKSSNRNLLKNDQIYAEAYTVGFQSCDWSVQAGSLRVRTRKLDDNIHTVRCILINYLSCTETGVSGRQNCAPHSAPHCRKTPGNPNGVIDHLVTYPWFQTKLTSHNALDFASVASCCATN